MRATHWDQGRVAGVVSHPNLKSLNIEESNLDDTLAKQLAASTQITHLYVGATKLSPVGLREICKMKQLEALDIWSLDLDHDDLDLLTELPNLQYLSVGGYDEQERLTFEGVWPHLTKLPALERVWLDGIPMTDEEAKKLRQRFQL